MKVKALVSLLALAGAISSANAAVNVTLGNAEIFVAAYDNAETKSFLFDTGINAASLIDGTINQSFNLSNDANWTSFVSSVGGINNINWTVGAIQAKNGINTKWIYSTLGAGSTTGAAINGSESTNTAFNGALNPLITLVSQSANVVAGTSEIDANGTQPYFGSAFNGFNPAGVASTFNKVNVGDVSFFGAANSNTSKGVPDLSILTAPTTVANLSTASGSAILTLKTPTPAVPEPSSAVLALTALAGMGVLARRRAK